MTDDDIRHAFHTLNWLGVSSVQVDGRGWEAISNYCEQRMMRNLTAERNAQLNPFSGETDPLPPPDVNRIVFFGVEITRRTDAGVIAP